MGTRGSYFPPPPLLSYSFDISTGVDGDDQPLPKPKHAVLTSVHYRFLFNNVLLIM